LTNGNEDVPTTQQQQERPSQTAALFGGLTAAAAADALQNLRLELTRVENERRSTQEALRRKTQEVDNLQSIVRQLSESRATALSARATLAEKYVDLSRAHERVSRVADLSHAVSKENLELTRNARSVAAEASKEAAEAKKEAEAAAKAEDKAAEENAILRQKVNLLERLVTSSGGSGTESLHHFSGKSVCIPEFTLPIETY
jgi:DNA repair exonuclease SbcCD ATPase subunit